MADRRGKFWVPGLDIVLEPVHFANGDYRASVDLRGVHDRGYMRSKCGNDLRRVVVWEDEDAVAADWLVRRWDPDSLQAIRPDGLHCETGGM